MNTRYTGVRGYGSRYGGGCGSYDISMVNRMMLKFRPIAPKPVASGSGFSDPRVENIGRSCSNKRRYVRVKRNNNKRKARPSTSSEKVISSGGDAVVTLSLMPETPEEKVLSRDGHVTLPDTVSFVTVERVMETTAVDGGVVVEWAEMGRDTCPRFVSDGGDRVVWTNRAYKEMVAGGDEVVVVVGKLEGGWPPVFTCNVKVVTCRMGMRTLGTLTVPCDAWRMGGGGYTWRLDVKAALCLGR
ncbi:uncharacterized protein LOC143555595 [Bidens hawaiensis]|uniref:uncharacterized protein LOC143555595 n=1 Tax=Bidens hawaiensis TaxID=980011 RepID=UPI004049172C